MRELIASMMRFSGAVTMFGLEQVQNAVSAPADTQVALTRLCNTLDAMAKSLASKLDGPKRAAFESISKTQTDMLDRTADVINLDAAGELMRKTSESLSSAVGRSNGRKGPAPEEVF
jgi:hypothetical protein